MSAIKMNEEIIKIALQKAEEAFAREDVPVGAVVFNSITGEVLCAAGNRVEADNNPLAHAEMLVLQEACRLLGRPNLTGYSLFSTVEPCPMCAGAIAWAKPDAVYFGASDEKSGAVESGIRLFDQESCHYHPPVESGFEAEECARLMKDFFKRLRQ